MAPVCFGSVLNGVGVENFGRFLVFGSDGSSEKGSLCLRTLRDKGVWTRFLAKRFRQFWFPVLFLGLPENFKLEGKSSWWTFRIFFIFFCSGAGEREEVSEEVAGGAGFN